MDQKKFLKKVEKADGKKLERMYFKTLDFEPGNIEKTQLGTLENLIETPAADSIRFSYYAEAAKQVDRLRYKILTGYGQCQGRLECYRNDVIICCCEKMAEMVAFRHAHFAGGRIVIPGEASSACREGDDTYIITSDREISLRGCPFCHAVLAERVSGEKGSE